MNASNELPPVAALVTAGLSQTEAEPITDSIFRIRDIANLYLVKTDDGDVLINSGLMDNVASNLAKLRPHRGGPLRKIIITQAHPDHFGGVPELREPETEIITERRFSDTCLFFKELAPYLKRRMLKLWGMTFDRPDDAPEVPEIVSDITVDGQLSFSQGNRQFEVISTPGGETLCSLTVWLPEERIAFVGNLFGPLLSSMPFLTTIRGEKPRLVKPYLDALDRVRKLGAEILIAGHSEPVRGIDNVRAVLDKMYSAVSYVRNETLKGMNDGKDVHTLMREIKLPPEIRIDEYHGTVAWAVRAIWEESSGWFHYDSTTSLYGVPRSSIDEDLVELAGGADALAQRAEKKLSDERPLEAMHLLDIALGATPSNSAALAVKKQVLEQLLIQAANINVSEVMWLRSELMLTELAQAQQE
ncbi:MAG: alkyl sulfatase dimerization domain-containing protein [Ketobacter sp.]